MTGLETLLRDARAWLRAVAPEAKGIILAFLGFLVLHVLVFQPFTIPSDSMEPMLKTGDYVVVSKFSYGWSRYSIPFSLPLFHGRIFAKTPRRGDVIVFKLPRDTHIDYVKRLIGLPGDHVQLLHGVVYINGRPLPQTAVGPALDPDAPWREVTRVRETMPSGKSYTTLKAEPDHTGETTGVYVVPSDQYFFMGDNRDNSLDSRWPAEVDGVGFVPAENLVGKAEVIVASWRGGASLFEPWTWFTRFDPSRTFRPVI